MSCKEAPLSRASKANCGVVTFTVTWLPLKLASFREDTPAVAPVDVNARGLLVVVCAADGLASCSKTPVVRLSFSCVQHLVRGGQLSGKDLNGLSDPYVVVRFGGATRTSRIIKKTVDPEWCACSCALHHPRCSLSHSLHKHALTNDGCCWNNSVIVVLIHI